MGLVVCFLHLFDNLPSVARVRRSAPIRRSFRFESLEARRLLAVVMSGEDQLLLELINRARANPTAEAARHGIGLNDGGTQISSAPKQPLAPHQALINAAGGHAADMLARDYFAHNSPDGVTPSDRARQAGYPGGAGENISWGGSTGPIVQLEHVYTRHQNLFRSSGHRSNMLTERDVDVGAAIRFGQFTNDRTVYNASMVAVNFGLAGDGSITGVAFTDLVTDDSFYDVGEGLGDVTVTARDATGAAYTTQTGPSGGYAIAAPPGVYTVTATGGNLRAPIAFTGVRHNLDGFENTKIDFDASTAPPADTVAPTAVAAALANIAQAGQTPQIIVVTYTDDRALDAAGIDGRDVIVVAPTGGSLPTVVQSVTPLDGNNTQVRVEYRLDPPGGVWDVPDDGVYSVRLQGQQVFDAFGNAVAARSLTNFSVQVGPRNTAWQNASNPGDVNDSGGVSVADLLPIVDYLRENSPGPLPPLTAQPAAGYIDVNGDGQASAADLLAEVTYLRAAQPEAEAEGTLSAALAGSDRGTALRQATDAVFAAYDPAAVCGLSLPSDERTEERQLAQSAGERLTAEQLDSREAARQRRAAQGEVRHERGLRRAPRRSIAHRRPRATPAADPRLPG